LTPAISRRALTLFFTCSVSSLALLTEAQIPTAQTAAGTNRPLKLDKNSPFQDPDIIYLEADSLINDETAGIITAEGEVEGRYQDRTLRADKVVYTLSNGRVIASGNVALIDATGATQFADKLELSNELEAGTASNFTARFPEGGITGAAFATRGTDEGVELYNAYYTACEACVEEDGSTKNPTWRIRARKVTQNKDRNMIQYRDAVFELAGLPVFYTPYLSHPDPSAGRASGWLNPFIGISNSKGFNVRAPYFIALDDYSDLTLTPRVFAKVNPLLELDYRRRFYSGNININSSLTYASAFDRRGNAFTEDDIFTNPDEATVGRKLRSHFFADGLFSPSDTWDWGFGVQLATDDLFLNRYDLDERPSSRGIYTADGRRLISQAFAVGQDDDFRFVTGTWGYQSLRTQITRSEDAAGIEQFTVSREDDSILPIIAPKIELEKYFTDPLGGRLKLFGDVTALTRKIGSDYTRASGGVDWNKTFIAPAGIEVKPFANARYDYVDLEDRNGTQTDFSRTIGQTGVDIRWPFIRSGNNVDIVIEPRIQLTQSFGDGKLDNFTSGSTLDLLQDSTDIDLDSALFWASNKSTGFDFWQEGFRADVGGSLTADWGNNRAYLFAGQSYASGFDDDFGLGTGLAGGTSDIVGQFELYLGRNLSWSTRIRYDDDDSRFRRIDTSFGYTHDRFNANLRYYKLDSAARQLLTNPNAPPEEISGSFGLKLTENWSTRYSLFRDIDRDATRRQALSLIYDDDCTRIEFIYDRNRNNLGVVGNSEGFGVRVSLLTLGDFAPE